MKVVFPAADEQNTLYKVGDRYFSTPTSVIFQIEVNNDTISFYVNPRYSEEHLQYGQRQLNYNPKNEYAACMTHGILIPFLSSFDNRYLYPEKLHYIKQHQDEHKNLHFSNKETQMNLGGKKHHYHGKLNKEIKPAFLKKLFQHFFEINSKAKKGLCEGKNLQLVDEATLKKGMETLKMKLKEHNNDEFIVLGPLSHPPLLPKEIEAIYTKNDEDFYVPLLSLYDPAVAQELFSKELGIEEPNALDNSKALTLYQPHLPHSKGNDAAATVFLIFAFTLAQCLLRIVHKPFQSSSPNRSSLFSQQPSQHQQLAQKRVENNQPESECEAIGYQPNF